MIKTLKTMIRDEEGATMVEYGLILSLVAVVCIGMVRLIGQETSTMLFTQISQSI